MKGYGLRDLEKQKKDDESKRADSQSAAATDQPHEVSQTNGVENGRIVSLLSLY